LCRLTAGRKGNSTSRCEIFHFLSFCSYFLSLLILVKKEVFSHATPKLLPCFLLCLACAYQLADGVWLPAKCAKEVVLKIREREGTQRPKPLWTDALELCGGDYAQVTERLFGTAGPTNWDSAM
jgi:hypothetical protein